MNEKLKEYVRESNERFLKSLPVEERLKGLSAKELVKALSPEAREALAQELKANGSASKPK